MDFHNTKNKSYSTDFQLLVVFLCLFLTYLVMACFLERSHFGGVMGLVGIAFAGYIGALYCYQQKQRSVMLGIAVAIVFRLLFITSTPSLSDDYFRFLWDGRLLLAGYNPFEFRPQELLENPIYKQLNLNELYAGLNSKNYFSVYPPVSQLWFVWAAWWGKQSIFMEIIALRSLIVVAEISSIFLLSKYTQRLQLPYYTPLIYALNPLIIIELTGNLHFEAVQIFFLLLSLYLLLQRHFVLSSIFFAMAVCSKLVPLIFLPFLFFKLGFKKGFLYCANVLLFTGLFFVSFINFEIIYKIGASVNLYFQTFEFNASIYYIIRELGYLFKGYNIIETSGKVLSLLCLTLILLYSFYQGKGKREKGIDIVKSAKRKEKNLLPLTSSFLPLPFLYILFIYYSFATTVHPWYIANIVIFATLSRQYWAISWSFLAFLSYHVYSYQPYKEQLVFVIIEYSLLFICFKRRKQFALATNH